MYPPGNNKKDVCKELYLLQREGCDESCDAKERMPEGSRGQLRKEMVAREQQELEQRCGTCGPRGNGRIALLTEGPQTDNIFQNGLNKILEKMEKVQNEMSKIIQKLCFKDAAKKAWKKHQI